MRHILLILSYLNNTPLVIIVDELFDMIYMYKSKSSKHVSDRLRYEAIIKILNIGPELNIFTIIATQSSDKDITKKVNVIGFNVSN